MSLLRPTDEDRAYSASHADAGLRLRVGWVKRLRAALRPFAEGRATAADQKEAQDALKNTEEWL